MQGVVWGCQSMSIECGVVFKVTVLLAIHGLHKPCDKLAAHALQDRQVPAHHPAGSHGRYLMQEIMEHVFMMSHSKCSELGHQCCQDLKAELAGSLEIQLIRVQD